jgi:hypothetical protein
MKRKCSETKRKKAKRNEMKAASKRNTAKISEKNILKQNEGKTSSIYFRFKAKQKIMEAT